jgi:ferredoxin
VVVDPDGAATDDVIQAAANCPVTAITVLGESGDLYP